MEAPRSLSALYHRGRSALRALRGEDMMEAAREGPRVVQLVSCLNNGDAVGNEVAAMGEILRRNRYASEIWTGWRHSRWDALPVRVISHLPPLGRDDLLIYHFASQCPFAGEIASLPCRVLLRYHNVTPSTYFHGYDAAAESATANALRQLPEILPAVDGCLPASRFSAEDLRLRGYGGPLEVLPVLLRWEDYTRPPDAAWLRRYRDGVINVLSVGRIVPNKHLEDVISAYAVFHERHPRSRLILAGSYGEEDGYYRFLQRHIRQLGAEGVEFTGHIRFEELLALYRAGDLYLCMSGHEGFCVPLVEAMAFGVPIAACRSSAVTETVGDGGLLFERGSFRAIADGMEELLAEREYWRQQEARQLRSFDYAHIQRRFLSLLTPAGPEMPFPFDSLGGGGL